MKPSFIFFDVGGVVIKDFSATAKMAELKVAIGIKPEMSQKFDEYWKTTELSICSGLEIDSLIPNLNRTFDLQLPAGFSLLEEYIVRFDKNEFILDSLSLTRSKSKIGLLTNMYPRMLQEIKLSGLIPEVSFDLEIDSSLVGFSKPKPEIYALAQKLANVPSQEILFIDNSPANLVEPAKLNWQTHLFDSTDYKKSSQELLAYIQQI